MTPFEELALLDALEDRVSGTQPWTEEDEIFEQLQEQEQRRQARIASGEEHACCGCGCSESLPCPGGCIWATATLCSGCV